MVSGEWWQTHRPTCQKSDVGQGERWGLMRWAVSCVPFLLLTQMYSSLFTLHHLSLLFMGNYTCYNRLGSEITHTFGSRFLRDQKVGPHLEGPRYNKGVSVRNTTSTEKKKRRNQQHIFITDSHKRMLQCSIALLIIHNKILKMYLK